MYIVLAKTEWKIEGISEKWLIIKGMGRLGTTWSVGQQVKGTLGGGEHTMPQGETILGSVDLFLMTSLRWTFGGSSSTGVGSNDAGLIKAAY